MSEQISIRQETQDDCREIFELNLIAFGQDNEAKLINALRDNPAAFVPELSLVATSNNKIVGHILFTRVSIRDEHGNVHKSLALAPMAVSPEFQNKGIGGLLIRKGFEAAKKKGFTSVIVLGHEHYYPRFGFAPAEKWNIRAPFKVLSPVFMAIELANNGLKNVWGTVIYPKEFEAV
jgi:putative acetyltransferase